MYQLKHLGLWTTALAAALLLSAPVSAKEVSVDPTMEFCFSGSDFLSHNEETGIFVTQVPGSQVAKVYYRDRVIQAGDALPASALDELTLSAECVTQHHTALGYYTVDQNGVCAAKELKLSILPRKNDPPTAQDSAFETYRNIPNSGSLSASDPENGPLFFELVDQPKRGSVTIEESGAFTYTPDENKVGNDYFTFRVRDNAGNYSEAAKVTITIKKPTDKEMYADMSGDPDTFTAMWMKDEGIFSGSTIGDHLCFCPDQAVSRGEFLVMTMKLVEAEADATQLTTGFADELTTPGWMQPYLVSALNNGMITGTSTEQGVCFFPEEPLTKVDAAVMLQNILQLPEDDSTTVFSDDTASVIPTWARGSSQALSDAGIPLQITSEAEPMTRRDAAQILYAVSRVLSARDDNPFFWVQ